MFIEHPEAFKTWLTSILEPLCDADPAALAKYVYALVKKDKPPDELRNGMLDQLDVFLQHETKPFVELLFKTLEKQEYGADIGGVPVDSLSSGDLTTASVATTGATAAVPVAATPVGSATNAAVAQKQIKASVPSTNSEMASTQHARVTGPASIKNTNRVVLSRSSAAPMHTGDSSGTLTTVTNVSTTAITSTMSAAPRANRYIEQTLVKVVPDLLEQATAEASVNNQSRFKRDRDRRRRSRSRSWERGGGRRERQPGREGQERVERGGRRAWRNRSPPPIGAQHNPDYRRRPVGSRSPSPPLRPPPPPGRYRNRSPPPGGARSRSRSRSPPPRHARHRDAHRHPRDVSPLPDRDDRSPASERRKRCRDFDEKGYCMRGDLCSWDHGVDPVVVEDAAFSSVLALGEYNPLAPDIWRGEPPPTSFPQPPPSQSAVVPPVPPLPPAGVVAPLPTNIPPPPPPPHHHQMYPMTPGYHRMLIAGGAPPPPYTSAPPPPPPQHNGGGRALVAIPRAAPPPTLPENHSMPPHALHQQNTQQQPRWKRRGPFNYNQQAYTKPPQNSSLVLRCIPPGLNDITHLNNHLSKFGKIVNMQVNYEGDPESALITFSSHAEANTAYKSTEAVLNNRFIRVFWHNTNSEEKSDVPGPAGTAPDLPAKKEETGAAGATENDKPPVSTAAVSTPNSTSVSAFTPLNNTHNKVLVNKENIGRMAAAAAVASGAAGDKRRLAATVRARGQQLLHRQLQHQRQLIQRLESNKVSGAAREALLSAVKAAQDGIEKLRKELLSTGTTNATPAPAPLTQEFVDTSVGRALSRLKLSSHQQKTVAAAVKAIKSREDTQKELLDAELDLFNKQHEGTEDIVEIQRRMVELRRLQHQTEQQNRRRFGRMGGRGGMGGTNMGRGGMAGAGKSVDHRPKTLLVAGLTHEESQQLTNYITQQPGALTTTTGGAETNGSDAAPATVNLVASFARRAAAEQTLSRIKTMFPNANANWLQQQGIPAKKNPESVSSLTPSAVQASSVQMKPTLTTVPNGITQNDNLNDDVKMNEGDECPEVALEDEEALLMGGTAAVHGADTAADEEEEEAEEEEERSWRR